MPKVTGRVKRGPDADKGGYDARSFWARGTVAERLTRLGQPLIAQQVLLEAGYKGAPDPERAGVIF